MDVIDKLFAAEKTIKESGIDRHILRRACRHHDWKWPESLTSGVMFFDGERITIEAFTAHVRIWKDATR